MSIAITPDERRRSAPKSASCPLSFEQEEIWFLHQMEDAAVAYNMPIAFRIEGDLDVELLRRAMGAVAQRHKTLRFKFRTEGEEPVQYDSGDTEVEVREIGPFDFALDDPRASEELTEEARRPFDLKRELPIRASVLRFSDAAALLVTMYHIVGDHSSLVKICEDLSQAYGAIKRGRDEVQVEAEGDYLAFARGQRDDWDEARSGKQLAFWKDRLSRVAPESYLVPDFGREEKAAERAGELRTFEISPQVAERLGAISRENGGTIFMTLLAAFKALLHRYSLQDEIVSGVPMDQRAEYDLFGTVGFFVRTLPFCTSVGGDPTFVELLGRIRQTTIETTRHAGVPLGKAAETTQGPREPGKNPFFSVIFQYLAEPNPRLKLEGCSTEWLPVHTETAKFDLTFTLVAEGNAISAEVEYDCGLYKAETIDRFCEHYLKFLKEIARDPRQRISEVNLLEAEEFERVVFQFNQTAAEYPREATVHGLFSAEAERNPDRVAICCGAEKVTYGELERRTNQLARILSRRSKPGEAVGILLERHTEAIAWMLGILKCGCAYVSLDPKLPAERLNEIARKANIRTLLTSSAHMRKAPAGVEGILLDRENVDREEGDPLALNSKAEDAAYILFTSGSTGGPKGVKVPHRAVVRLVKNTNFADLGPEQVFLQLAPLSFDASTLEIWGALLNGGRCAVFPGELSSLQELGSTIQSEGVTALWLTAGLFNQVIDENPGALKGVKQLLAGGDVLSVAHVRKAQALLPGCRLINGYGPTENTTFTCCYRIPENWNGGRTVPIGKPISNTQVFILDEHLRPAPIGVPGELYAGGAGLALGYAGDEEATTRAFIRNPFAPHGGERLYKTGDRARWLADGRIEFLGRSDQQVKIRGFRIELAEIEDALRKHPEVQDCVVAARNGDAEEKSLAGYVIRRSGKIEASTLRGFLSEKLPSYMVPSHFIFLEKIPTNANGKVDRRALALIPLPEKRGAINEVTDPVQLRLLAIWREVLKHEAFTVDDNFFDLGGHSLLVVKMVSRVNSAFGTNLTMRTVFQAPTISRLAAEVQARSGAAIPVAPIARRRNDSASRLLENLSTLTNDEVDRLLQETTM
jgi:amino acid adenylation domain-containing protein